MSSLISSLARGLDIVQQVLNNNTNTPEYRLADEISKKMTTYEQVSITSMRPSICCLYLNFFLSILGIFEASLKCMLFLLLPVAYIMLWFAAFLVYYITLCISCGRTEGAINVIENICKGLSKSSQLFCIYVGIISGLLVNLIVPWHAPYSFYKTRVYLKRPPGSSPVILEIDYSDSSLFIPKHIILSHFLFVATGINSLFCSLIYEDYMRIVAAKYEREIEQDTIKFYQETYGCQGLDQLLYNSNANNDSGRMYQPSNIAHSQSTRYQEPVHQETIHQAIAIPIDSDQQCNYVQVVREIPTQNKV